MRDVSAAHLRAMDDPSTIGARFILAGQFYWLTDFARVLRDAYPDRAPPARAVQRRHEDDREGAPQAALLVVREGAQAPGRSLIPGDEAIRAETLIRYGAA